MSKVNSNKLKCIRTKIFCNLYKMTKKLKYHSLETKSLGEKKFEVLNLCKSQYAIKL